MKTRLFPIISLPLVLALIAFAAAPAPAAAGGRTLNLQATSAHTDAYGTARITGDQIQILAGGLKPDAVYTVWFVNTRPKKHETGAGEPPHMFRTDADGDAVYASNLEESPVGEWEMVMIVQHPNGDPRDMKGMVGALKAKI
jgi:hypothetical protein